MKLVKIKLKSLEKNFDVFQFNLYYDNNTTHILKYTLEDVGCIFGNLVESTTMCTCNNEIFELLNIYDANKFVSNIVGYPTPYGVWPEVKTKTDFIKVLHTLEYYLEF